MTGLMVCVVLSAGAAAGCSTCNRDGCEAMAYRASEVGMSAIAGAVSSESDVVANGCAECPLSWATIGLWQTDALVTNAGTAQRIVDGPELLQFRAEAHYGQPLNPGNYLLCSDSDSCVAVRVLPERTTTVNIHSVFGPTTFYVAEPGESETRRAESFSVTF